MRAAMTDFPFDLVVFDLDGTLADTSPDLAAALNHVMGELGQPGIAPERVRHLVGHGAKALIRKGLAGSGVVDEVLVERGYPIFMDYYGSHICVGTRAFDGVEEALADLHGRGVATAICTNKPESLSLQLAEALGWTARFPVLVGGDTLPVKKPDPAPLIETIARAGGKRAAFVGDSIVDADTARAAGVPFVAVSFGFADRPIDQLGADAVIDDYAELVPALLRISGS